MVLPILTLMSVDILVDELESSIKEYKLLKSENSFKDLANRCQLLCLKHMVGDDLKKAIQLEKESEDTRKIKDSLSNLKY